eukprot:8493064-Pyramimonas_sp.AAC.1
MEPLAMMICLEASRATCRSSLRPVATSAPPPPRPPLRIHALHQVAPLTVWDCRRVEVAVLRASFAEAMGPLLAGSRSSSAPSACVAGGAAPMAPR